MKINLFIVLFAALAITSCKQAPVPAVVDVEHEKATIDSVFNLFDSAWRAQNTASLALFLTEDALCLGSDPSEFLSKQQITEM